MNIFNFVQENLPKAKVSADISSRWLSRVVANGWHTRGRDGANAYIGQYLKGAGVQKVVAFAAIAKAQGHQDFANGMLEHAFYLSTGQVERIADEGGNSVAHVEIQVSVKEREDFGIRPALPSPITRERAEELVRKSNYVVQEKKDGRHLLVSVEQGQKVTGGNKAGLVTRVPLSIVDAIRNLGTAIVDGEDVKGVFFAFDLLKVGNLDLRDKPYSYRREALHTLIAPFTDHRLQILDTFSGAAAEALLEKLESEGKEGAVFKDDSATYDADEWMWKFQFRASHAFVVGEKKSDKASVELFVHRSDGSKRSMGFVTVKPNMPIPAPGEVVEVKYLYAYPEGKLIQPELLHVRRDGYHPEECLESKLRFKNDGDTQL